MSKYIFDPKIKRQVDEILVPLKHPELWQALDLSFAKFPSAVVRMEGLPGSGKTALAEFMARTFKREPVRISFADVVRPKVGETEMRTVAVFQDAIKRDARCIIMEECDAMLYSRDLIGEDQKYVLGFMNTLLIEIDKFTLRDAPSLLILTTNYPKILDAAMESRVTDVIKLEIPTGDFAIQIWKDKLPKTIKPTKEELEILANAKLNPRQIQNVIRKACRKGILSSSFVEMKNILMELQS